MIGITGRKKLIIQTIHNKRERRGRLAAKRAHESLVALGDVFEQLYGADARSTQERGVTNDKRRMN